MPQIKRPNSEIVDFQPDNDENTIYVLACDNSITLTDLIDIAREKWGTWGNDISISAEHVHTRCIYYDRYDSSDYDDYIVLRKES